jgi:hypothetical protein
MNYRVKCFFCLFYVTFARCDHRKALLKRSKALVCELTSVRKDNLVWQDFFLYHLIVWLVDSQFALFNLQYSCHRVSDQLVICSRGQPENYCQILRSANAWNKDSDCQISDAAFLGWDLCRLELPVREIVYHFCVPRLLCSVSNFELHAAPFSSRHVQTILSGWTVDWGRESLNSCHLLQNLLPCGQCSKKVCKPLAHSRHFL